MEMMFKDIVNPAVVSKKSRFPNNSPIINLFNHSKTQLSTTSNNSISSVVNDAFSLSSIQKNGKSTMKLNELNILKLQFNILKKIDY